MDHATFATDDLDGRARYELLTSIVVPRPIGWISSYGEGGVANLAPFSYFAALSSSPMLVGASIGHRSMGPKDTLVNIRHTRAFCTNVVTESQLERMNATSGDYPASTSEFAEAGLAMGQADDVEAPFVADCPVVMECELFKEVDLGSAPNTLVIGRVVRIRIDPALPRVEGTAFLDPLRLAPVGRLWGPTYAKLGEIVQIPRPKV